MNYNVIIASGRVEKTVIISKIAKRDERTYKGLH